MDWNITLTRMNGSSFELDVRHILALEQRRDGGTDIKVGGKKPTPCRESMLEVARLMNDVVRRRDE